MSDMVNCLVKLRIAIAKKWAQHKTEKLEALVQVCSYIITVLTIFMSPPLYTEVRTCWFTSVCSVCLSRSVQARPRRSPQQAREVDPMLG